MPHDTSYIYEFNTPITGILAPFKTYIFYVSITPILNP